MWQTSCRDRVLRGKERSLFIQGAACLFDHLLEEAAYPDEGEGCAWHTGVPPFDHLEPRARIVLVPDVAQP